MSFQKYLYDKVLPVIQAWNEDEIYAISFLVYTNEDNIYNGFTNFPEFLISYNTEKDCEHSSKYSEERWNYAFWRQDTVDIITTADDEGSKTLLEWYMENGITNIGFEDSDNDYDENMAYIGKGPVGYYELLCVVSNVARELQKNGIIKVKFGDIPIIVHDLDYSWYVKDATENANPDGQAKDFLIALDHDFEE